MSKIITTPDPRLRRKSKKVSPADESAKKIVDEMVRLSLDWEDAHPYELSAAMAAPQMGHNVRIIIIRDDMEDKSKATFTALINPEVIKTEGKTLTDYEGCLSVPLYYGLVPRPAKARVKARLLDGTEVRIRATGTLARTLLHEIDHLDGLLFIDHIRNDKSAWFKMNDQGDLDPVDYDAEIAANKALFPDDD